MQYAAGAQLCEHSHLRSHCATEAIGGGKCQREVDVTLESCELPAAYAHAHIQRFRLLHECCGGELSARTRTRTTRIPVCITVTLNLHCTFCSQVEGALARGLDARARGHNGEHRGAGDVWSSLLSELCSFLLLLS